MRRRDAEMLLLAAGYLILLGLCWWARYVARN